MADQEMQLVLVTPERTLLDEPVASLQFPLYDGQIGVLPGRAPLVGRLGAGELVISSAGASKSYFLDGGFVQIKGRVVTLLTSRAMSLGDLDSAAAESELQEAQTVMAKSDEEYASKQAAQERARKMIQLARKPR